MLEKSERGGRSGRWIRREVRKDRERHRIKKHGAGFGGLYAAAVRKRIRKLDKNRH